ncbi:hypothetical protein JYT82_00645 [bacterium AH-315-K20]|nr:hypothetical protein [bacterium AH-315-K20]
MNAMDAQAIAMNVRARFDISEEFTPTSVERRIVELVKSPSNVDELPEPGPTRDIFAWVVTLVFANHCTEITIDETGEVVRLSRSR